MPLVSCLTSLVSIHLLIRLLEAAGASAAWALRGRPRRPAPPSMPPPASGSPSATDMWVPIRLRLSQLVSVLQDYWSPVWWGCADLVVQVEIKNGIFELTLSNPDGIVTGVRYNGVDNLMEILNKEDNRGYGTNFRLLYLASVCMYVSSGYFILFYLRICYLLFSWRHCC